MVKGLNEKNIEVRIPNEFGYERIAMESSASFARMLGFIEERVEDLKTAVSEACLNAMEHGNESRPEAQVTLNLKFTNNTLTVSVKDEGVGIREFPEDPDIKKQVQRLVPPRGLGIFLIKRLVDHVEFNQIAPEGHVVRIAMKLTL
jgi:serine/threonine-protein kinase RsbW